EVLTIAAKGSKKGESVQLEDLVGCAEVPDYYLPAAWRSGERWECPWGLDSGHLAIRADSEHASGSRMLEAVQLFSAWNFQNADPSFRTPHSEVVPVRTEPGRAQAVLQVQHFLAGRSII